MTKDIKKTFKELTTKQQAQALRYLKLLCKHSLSNNRENHFLYVVNNNKVVDINPK